MGAGILAAVLSAAVFSACVDSLLSGSSNNGAPGPSEAPPTLVQGVQTVSGDETVLVTWNTPVVDGKKNAGNAGITRYQAWAIADTLRLYADTTLSCTAKVPDTTCTLNGLTNGKTYQIVVVAFNAGTSSEVCTNHDYPGSYNGVSVAGRSCASALTRALPVGPARTVPGAPQNVQVSADGTKAILSWTAPLNDGGAPVTGYIVTAISDTTLQCKTTGALTCTVTGLTNGRTYTFVIQAVNRYGAGTEWAASAPVTAAPYPDAPTSVVAVAGHAEVKVSWTAPPPPAGAPITGYTVLVVSDTTKRCLTAALTCTVGGLLNGTTYTFVVRALNSTGFGPLSAPSAPATPTAPSPWTGRTSGTTNDLNAVTLKGSTYVIVGSSGTILTSSNGTNWVSRNPGTTRKLTAVAGSGTLFAAVGDSGTILTSPTGSSWTTRASTGAALNGIVYTGKQWVAVGDSGILLSSDDALTWTARTAASRTRLNAVAWSGSMLVAVGDSGRVLTSTDGVTWTVRASGATGAFKSIVWADSVFIAVGGNGAPLVRGSSDGINWNARSISAGAKASLYATAWSGNQLLVVGDAGAIYGADDPSHSLDVVTTLFGNLYGAAGTSAQWVVVGSGGVVFSSP